MLGNVYTYFYDFYSHFNKSLENKYRGKICSADENKAGLTNDYDLGIEEVEWIKKLNVKNLCFKNVMRA